MPDIELKSTKNYISLSSAQNETFYYDNVTITKAMDVFEFADEDGDKISSDNITAGMKVKTKTLYSSNDSATVITALYTHNGESDTLQLVELALPKVATNTKLDFYNETYDISPVMPVIFYNNAETEVTAVEFCVIKSFIWNETKDLTPLRKEISISANF